MTETFIGGLKSFWILWVMILFCGIVFWAYWPKNRMKIESYGQIPLKDEGEER